MVAGSPAWNPHATLTEVAKAITASSLAPPSLSSPTSQFRSIHIRLLDQQPKIAGGDGHEPHLVAGGQTKPVRRRRRRIKQPPGRAPDQPPAAWPRAGIDPGLAPRDPDRPGRHPRARRAQARNRARLVHA